MRTHQWQIAHSRRYAQLLREVRCRAVSFNVRELICQYLALAGDPDGTFAVARMQPCFQVAVKIATVVAARPGGGPRAGRLASTAAWAGLAWAAWLVRVPRVLCRRWARMVSAGSQLARSPGRFGAAQ